MKKKLYNVQQTNSMQTNKKMKDMPMAKLKGGEMMEAIS